MKEGIHNSLRLLSVQFCPVISVGVHISFTLQRISLAYRGQATWAFEPLKAYP